MFIPRFLVTNIGCLTELIPRRQSGLLRHKSRDFPYGRCGKRTTAGCEAGTRIACNISMESRGLESSGADGDGSGRDRTAFDGPTGEILG